MFKIAGEISGALASEAAGAMKPYYEHAGITIYHGDCREVLPYLTADACVTDPPYGINLVTKTSDYTGSKYFDAGASLLASTLYSDEPSQIRELIQQVMPLLLGIIDRALVFCGPRMIWAYPEPAGIGCVFIPSGAGRSAWGFQYFQPILFYGKDPYLADGKGGQPNSFRTEQPNLEHFDHPCPKPISWMNWAVNRASRPGETVVDPFMGSGTTLRACKDRGRNAIGIEIEERYCEIAAKRLAQEVLDFTAVEA
jgi:site-specific DNA-methyltransferase (adenine-specific)